MRFVQEISVFNPKAIETAVIHLGTSITQTAEEIRTEAEATYATQETVQSTFSQTATSFAFTLSKNGDKTASLAMSYTKGDGSVISLEAQSIEFNSLVTFNNLSTSGQTTINGSNITTGIIQDAGKNTIFNLSDGTLTMKKGSINISNKFIVTDQGVMTATSGNIGGSSSPWHIGSNNSNAYIYSGSKTSMDRKTAGIYIGTNGIEIKASGNNVTRLDNSGILTTYIEMFDQGVNGGAGGSTFMYLDDRTDYSATNNRWRMLFTKGIATGYDGVSSADNWFYNMTHLEGGYDRGSDRRIKKNISRLDSKKAKDFLMGLIPSEYNFTNTEDTTLWHHGFVAQDVEPIAWDGLVSGKGDEMKGIAYDEIIADIVAVLQDLLAEKEG